ncbi:MAG: hypothetical protein IPN13_17820 [Bacteroidetes bacterium]|nr:hypothetical protein [Bacteroidota bacterium]
MHSTGHSSRLGRKEIIDNHGFGTEMYSIEELTAEMGACMLKSITGIRESVSQNNLSYIQNWISVLKRTGGFLFMPPHKLRKLLNLF